MKTKLLSLFVTLVATTALWASNTITYTASSQLSGYNGSLSVGKTAFGSAITSHTFSNGTGTITCNGEITKIGNSTFYLCEDLISIIIPNSVTAIEERAFAFCVNLEIVSLSEGLLSIGANAFSTSGLKSIILPESLEFIGEYAFEWCYKLGDMIIPNKVTSIGFNTFAHCESMTQCKLGASVQSIDFVAFQGCKNLTSITIPKSVTTIGNSVFTMDSALVSIDVEEGNPNYCSIDGVLFTIDTTTLVSYPEGRDGLTYTMPQPVRYIQYGAFAENWQLEEVILSDSLLDIGDYAFSGCRALKIANIPNQVTRIGEWAYANCMQMDSIRLGSGIQTIGDCGLMINSENMRIIDCYLFKPISIGLQALDYIPSSCLLVVNPGTAELWRNADGWNTMTIIERENVVSPDEEITWTFKDGLLSIFGSGPMEEFGASNLIPWGAYINQIDSVYIQDGITTIASMAFLGCSNLKGIYIPSSVMVLGEMAFEECDHLNHIQLSDNLTTIGLEAFYGCDALTTIYIPATVDSIGHVAFANCPNLQSIIVDSNNSVFASKDGVLFNKDYTTLLVYPMGGEKTYTIPQSVTKINDEGFYLCNQLQELTIPSSVTYIGSNAFYYCESLHQLIIPESVETLGWGVFYLCTNMTEISLPSTLQRIGQQSFQYCTSLQTIVCYADNPPLLGDFVFDDMPQSSVTLYVPARSVDAYKQADGWKEFTNIIGICEGDPYFIEQDTIICGHPYPFVWEGDTVRYGGEVEHWGDSWYWRSRIDTVTRNYISVGGCDSILQLVVYYPGYHYGLINDTIEEGQSHWSGYTETGIYYERYPNVYGCDSIVLELHLFVMPKPIYMVTLSVNNAKYGSMEGNGTYNEGDTVVLSATPNKGYQFNQWSDGNTDNPRTIYNIDKDYTLTAQFGIKQCSWLVESNDLEMGAVYTDFTNEYYNYGTQITVEASANSGYKFVKWNDGKKHNPYKFSILEDKYLLAIFIAEEEEVDTTQVQPSDTTATFTWPFIFGGFTYTLTIYLDAACTIPFCTLTFNQYGQLIGITFGAHAPRRSAMANQEEGFTTTINGLSAGTEYFYKMETKDEEGKLINTDEGGFITKNSGVVTNINRVLNNSIHNSKFIMDGHLYILRDGNLYTATGAKVK